MIKPFVLLNTTLLIHRHREPPKLRSARFGEPRARGPPSPLEKAKESDKSKVEISSMPHPSF